MSNGEQAAELSVVDASLHAPVHNSDQRTVETSSLRLATRQISIEIPHSNFCPCCPFCTRMANKFLISCYPCSKGIANASGYTRLSAILLLLALLLEFIAITTPYWEYVVNDLGDSHSGLWWVCIIGICDQLIKHALFNWFRIVQALMLLSTFGLVSAAATTALYIFAIALDTYKKKFLFGAFISSLITGVMLLIAVVVYGVYQGEPDLSTLSWSYYLALLSSLLTILTTTCLALEVHRLLTLPARSDEAVILQNRSTVILPTEGTSNVGRDRSESTLSVSSLMDNPEKRPLNKGEVRMRSYSSSLMTPIPESPSAASTGSAPGDLPGRKFTFSDVKPVSA